MPPFPNFEFIASPNYENKYFLVTAEREKTGTVIRELLMYNGNEPDSSAQHDAYLFVDSVAPKGSIWNYKLERVDRQTFENALVKRRDEENLILKILQS